jgi:hypothetical protein
MKYKVKICGGVSSIQDYWETEIITDDLDKLKERVRKENATIVDIQEVTTDLKKNKFETVFVSDEMFITNKED